MTFDIILDFNLISMVIFLLISYGFQVFVVLFMIPWLEVIKKRHIRIYSVPILKLESFLLRQQINCLLNIRVKAYEHDHCPSKRND